jgi:RNase H-fold protein (predicted Holliday junction resolvase)
MQSSQKFPKFIGIDYGTKRVGVAVSSDDGAFALPHSVLANDALLLENIKKICEERDASSIVLGDPGENDLKKDVEALSSVLEGEGFTVFLEKEFMTSLHTDSFNKKKPIARKVKQERGEKKDESAAALILQRFLDKQKFN